jgi:hypothetical protein
MTDSVDVQGTIGNGVTNEWWLYSKLRLEEEGKKADESENKRVV